MSELPIRPTSIPMAPVGGASSGPGGAGGAGGKSFKEFLSDSISEANRMQVEAQDAMNRFTTGETANQAEVISAVRQAELAFNMMMEVRNKLIDAYQEVLRMRV